MNRRNILALSAAAVALGLAMPPGKALAQQKTLKEQLIGSWAFVSGTDTQPDGTKRNRWGPNPTGSLMFDANGRFIQIISRSDIPKFAANTANQGTAEENKAVLGNMIVSFGTFTVNEATKTIVTQVEGGTFPNAVGGEQKRIITALTEENLAYINPVNSVGSSSAVNWKRVK